MDRPRAATVALVLLALGCSVAGAPHPRVHHNAQFRKLTTVISSDASTSQSFGDVVFGSSALAPEGSDEAETSPEPSTEEETLSPAVAPDVSPEVAPEVSPDAAPEISPDAAPEISPEVAPGESPGESPQAAEPPVEPPADSPKESPAEAPEPFLIPPEEAPADAPDVVETLEKDIPDLFPASAPDIGPTPIDLEELSRQQILDTSRILEEDEVDVENAAGKKSGAVLGLLMAFILAWAMLP